MTKKEFIEGIQDAIKESDLSEPIGKLFHMYAEINELACDKTINTGMQN